MPEEVFLKILDDLEDMEYKGAIHPYLMAEPLTDLDIFKKILTIRRRFPSNTIFISTNGDHLSSDTMDCLIGAGITWIGVSQYDFSNKEIPELDKKYKELVVTPLGKLRSSFYNRGGNINVASINKNSSCGWVFEKAYINWKGDVILCCSDYKFEVVFGNVMKDTFENIYNSSKYNKYRVEHTNLKGKELPLCESCNRLS